MSAYKSSEDVGTRSQPVEGIPLRGDVYLCVRLGMRRKLKGVPITHPLALTRAPHPPSQPSFARGAATRVGACPRAPAHHLSQLLPARNQKQLGALGPATQHSTWGGVTPGAPPLSSPPSPSCSPSTRRAQGGGGWGLREVTPAPLCGAAGARPRSPPLGPEGGGGECALARPQGREDGAAARLSLGAAVTAWERGWGALGPRSPGSRRGREVEPSRMARRGEAWEAARSEPRHPGSQTLGPGGS